jgi:hypothetical protein
VAALDLKLCHLKGKGVNRFILLTEKRRERDKSMKGVKEGKKGGEG